MKRTIVRFLQWLLGLFIDNSGWYSPPGLGKPVSWKEYAHREYKQRAEAEEWIGSVQVSLGRVVTRLEERLALAHIRICALEKCCHANTGCPHGCHGSAEKDRYCSTCSEEDSRNRYESSCPDKWHSRPPRKCHQ